MLTKHDVAVSTVGELVVLKIADLRFSIEFLLALKLAAAIKFHARIAKLNSGRDERGFHLLGLLHDANAPKSRRQRFAERPPELLRPHGLDVRAAGQLVVITIGRYIAKFPYPEARALSQWLRVRGKEAKRNAGEKAHWSEIDNMRLAAAGERAW